MFFCLVFGPPRDATAGNVLRRLRDRPGGAVVNGSSSSLSDMSFEGFDVNDENDSDDDDDDNDLDLDDDDVGGSDWTSASDLEGGEWFDV